MLSMCQAAVAVAINVETGNAAKPAYEKLMDCLKRHEPLTCVGNASVPSGQRRLSSAGAAQVDETRTTWLYLAPAYTKNSQKHLTQFNTTTRSMICV